MSSTTLELPTISVGDEPPRQIPLVRRLLLLSIFCFAQFLDSFSMSTVFSAVPVLERSLNITTSQGVWIVSGNQLTFASTLLIVRLAVLCLQYRPHVYFHT